ncbi:MAG: polysaccharide biosynthesis protein [Epsilonproteobacteria bacterium]|nr:polysaccharide biosynthesis protein [Campylobacterota bacterium]
MPVSFFQPTRYKRTLFFLVADIVISMVTIYMAYFLRFNFAIPNHFYEGMFLMMSIIIPIKVFVFWRFKIYFIAWRFFGLNEYKRLIYAHLIVYTLFIVIYIVMVKGMPFPRSSIVIDMFLSLFFIGLLRISKRLHIESSQTPPQKTAIIYGANEQTSALIKSALNGDLDYYPIAIMSSYPHLIGTYFSNIPVYDASKLEEMVQNSDIQAVLITKKFEQKELDNLVSTIHKMGIKEIKQASILKDAKKNILKDVSIEDLLSRQPTDLDSKVIEEFIHSKVVMITGAGGSIGSELSRQVVAFGASKVILVDHSEFNLYSIAEELKEANAVFVMKSVRHKDSLKASFDEHKPDIVIHAAAYKHVPLCERNIKEAIENNIFGTKNVIDLAIESGVKKLVLISTDKAVRPTNVMGTTKRICELYARAVPSKNTEIVAVRFGNVLGSSGSVIPKFRSLIEKGEDLTVTHPDITRYFMMIPEAVQLVLQSASIAKGGELFILDMGEPVKIVDLAKKMIELSGRSDIDIVFTGLREGEKLYEELLIDESDLKTQYPSIMVSQDKAVDIDELILNLNELRNSNEPLKILKKIVPEFNHQLN